MAGGISTIVSLAASSAVFRGGRGRVEISAIRLHYDEYPLITVNLELACPADLESLFDHELL